MLKKIKKTRSEHKIFQSFAENKQLVYFGTVEDKDHAVVQGATFSTNRHDEHFMHGRHNGFDVSILKRTASYQSPKSAADKHTWLVIQVENLDISLPFVFINAREHSWNYYNQLHAKYPTLKEISQSFKSLNPNYTQSFRTYCKLSSTHFAHEFLHDTLMQQLAYYYPTHDVELEGSSLRIVVPFPDVISHKSIDSALSQALWLAESAEYRLLEESEAETTLTAAAV